jgi:hypothetical protein
VGREAAAMAFVHVQASDDSESAEDEEEHHDEEPEAHEDPSLLSEPRVELSTPEGDCCRAHEAVPAAPPSWQALERLAVPARRACRAHERQCAAPPFPTPSPLVSKLSPS